MGLQVSTGFKDKIFGPHAFETIFANGVIKLYAGSQPERADFAVGASVHVANITAGEAFTHGVASGLNFVRYRGIMTNSAPWTVLRIGTGNASWARLCSNPLDDGGISDTLPRIDFSVYPRTPGVAPANYGLYLNAIAFSSASEPQSLDVFYYTIPPI